MRKGGETDNRQGKRGSSILKNSMEKRLDQ